MRACSHPSGNGPSELGLDLLFSTAAATAATFAAAAVFRGSSHVVVRVRWLSKRRLCRSLDGLDGIVNNCKSLPLKDGERKILALIIKIAEWNENVFNVRKMAFFWKWKNIAHFIRYNASVMRYGNMRKACTLCVNYIYKQICNFRLNVSRERRVNRGSNKNKQLN